jgi:hypothetical protein
VCRTHLAQKVESVDKRHDAHKLNHNEFRVVLSDELHTVGDELCDRATELSHRQLFMPVVVCAEKSQLVDDCRGVDLRGGTQVTGDVVDNPGGVSAIKLAQQIGEPIGPAQQAMHVNSSQRTDTQLNWDAINFRFDHVYLAVCACFVPEDRLVTRQARYSLTSPQRAKPV